MEIRLWGTRGSIASPGPETMQYGGNTTCAEILLQDKKRIIIDAGTGIRALGRALSQDSTPLDCHLLITHIHWDHILGFPFFSPVYEERTRIRVDGCARSIKGLRTTLDNRMLDGVFPLSFADLSARIVHEPKVTSGKTRIGEAQIEAIELQHPQGGMGFRFLEGDRTLVFLTDNELWPDAWPGRTPSDFADFCDGAQLLIHDAQYRPEEISKRRGWGHSDCLSAVDLALQAGVERLLLFHHDPDRSDSEIEKIVQMCREYAGGKSSQGLTIEAAREGQLLKV